MDKQESKNKPSIKDKIYYAASYVVGPVKRGVTKRCWHVIRFLQADSLGSPKSDLPDLCPTLTPENSDVAANALDIYLSRMEIKEIAITAPYAAGKSSFIKSYFKSRYFYRVKYISLATFLDQIRDKSKPLAGDDHNAGSLEAGQTSMPEIEASLLEQITEKSIRLPQKTPAWLVTGGAILVSLVGVFLHSHRFELEDQLMAYQLWRYPDCIAHFFASLAIGFIVLGIRDLVKVAQRYTLRKVSVFKVGVELDMPESKSVLGRNISSILHSFCINKVDVVVVEDLDRFKCEEIFLKLKEVNKHINDCESVGRPVRFIYAIGDDVFNRYNRTKFFDAVIPIIPATTMHKSAARLKELVKTYCGGENECENLKEVIDSVALYIVDMRLLANIVADYKITLEALESTHGIFDAKERRCIFGFVVYRNYYPEDYDLLQSKRGMLYFLTSYANLKRFRLAALYSVEEKKAQLMDDIKDLRTNNVKGLRELNWVYFIRAVHFEGWSIDEVEIRSSTSLHKYLVTADEQFPNNPVGVNRFQYGSRNLKVFKEDGNSYLSYLRQSGILKKGVRALEKELSELSSEIARIERLSLRDLILEFPDAIEGELKLDANPSSDQVESKDSQHIDPLLKVLISQGYLDEHYMDYAYHRHSDDDLGENEFLFLKAVKEYKAFEIDIPLRNISVVQSKMDYGDFRSPAVINFNFIQYLLAKGDRYVLSCVLISLKRNTSDPVRVAFDVWRNLEDQKNIVAQWIVQGWEDICSEVVSLDEVDDFQKLHFLISLISSGEQSNGRASILNQANILGAFLSQCSYVLPSHLMSKVGDVHVIFSIFEDMDVRFVDLSCCPQGDDEYLELCVEYNVYALNEANVKTIAKHLGVVNSYEEAPDCYEIFKTENNFSSRLKENLGVVAQLIIDDVLVVSAESDVVEILSSSKVEAELKHSFIQDVFFEISNLEALGNIDDTTLILLDNFKRVEPNWNNLNFIASRWSGEDCLNILNRNYSKLAEELILLGDDKCDEVRDWLPFFDVHLSLDAFQAFTTVLGVSFDEVQGLTEDKVNFLIENEMVPVSEIILANLDTQYSGLAAKYVERNLNALLDMGVFDQLEISVELLLAVNELKAVDDNDKKKLFDCQRQCHNTEYWSGAGKLTLKVIKQICGLVDDRGRLAIVIGQIPLFDVGRLKSLISICDKELSAIFEGKKERYLEPLDSRMVLLGALKDVGFIESFEVVEQEATKRVRVVVKGSDE